MIFTVKKPCPSWVSDRLKQQGFKESKEGFACKLADIGEKKPRATARTKNYYKPAARHMHDRYGD